MKRNSEGTTIDVNKRNSDVREQRCERTTMCETKREQ
jgi:hypothetical protein